MTRDYMAIERAREAGQQPNYVDLEDCPCNQCFLENERERLTAEIERLQERERKLLEQNLAMMRVIAHHQEEMDKLRAERDSNREDCAGLVQHNNRQYDEIVKLRDERDAAFQRGAKNMRNIAVAIAHKYASLTATHIVNELLAAPLPEDKL